MTSSFQEKETKLIHIFSLCQTEEAKYMQIMEMGKELESFPEEQKTDAAKIEGCQSTMYIQFQNEDGKLFFSIDSEALISKGLGALLLFVYNGETAETILKQPPEFLQKLGIHASLTPGRSNGLSSIHLRMKQEALNSLLK